MDKVKLLVARTFVELGAKDVFRLRDTLFLEHGRCLAVAYRADDLSTVFCCTDRIIEFRNAAGKLLRTLSVPEASRSSSAAAQAAEPIPWKQGCRAISPANLRRV